MYYLGVDVGGTNIAVGIIDESNKIVAKASVKCPVPCTEEFFCDTIVATCKEALDKLELTFDDVPWIGIGCPGTVNRATGIIEFANNLYFENFKLRDMVAERTGGKLVVIENDANAAAYGEYQAGALQGANHALAITLGTGVGGGIIIDGKVYSGSNFAGGELGHTVIVVDGRQCTCGRKGCWETYASATGLIKTTKEHMANAPKDSPLWTIVEGDIEKVNGRTAFDAMRAGDPNGKAAVDEYIKYLSVGLTDMVNIFQPAILCIGGGICNEGETLLAPVREFVAAESYGRNPEKRTKICKAALGNDAGIIGAALLGKQGD